MEQNKTHHPVFSLVERNPKVLDDHSRWLNRTGESLLRSIEDSVRADFWPHSASTSEQASLGAFNAGVNFATRLLRELSIVVQDRNKLKAVLQTSNTPGDTDKMTTDILAQFGYTEEDLQK